MALEGKGKRGGLTTGAPWPNSPAEAVEMA
jgi:hypothetical protein